MLISATNDCALATLFRSPAAWLASVFLSAAMSYTNTSEVPAASVCPVRKIDCSVTVGDPVPVSAQDGEALTSLLLVGEPSAWLARTASPASRRWKSRLQRCFRLEPR
jgi:hypothetical protein